MESALIKRIEAEARSHVDLGLISADIKDLTTLWQSQVVNEPHRFINDDLSINVDALRNFRRLQIFVPDIPAGTGSGLNLRYLLGGTHRSGRRMLRDRLATLEEMGYDHLLRRQLVRRQAIRE